MINSLFKKTIFISLLGHITVFSIFSFSFGQRITPVNFTNVYFWGKIFGRSDLLTFPKQVEGQRQGQGQLMRDRSLSAAAAAAAAEKENRRIFIKKTDIKVLVKVNPDYSLETGCYLKPPINLILNEKKMTFASKVIPTFLYQEKKEPVIMFYPSLPYHFLLYFKDRQIVHIELMFNLISSGIKNSIVIKRKISSGNLEADLLTMRYISRYLFIEHMGFSVATDSWHTVNIDLSTKND